MHLRFVTLYSISPHPQLLRGVRGRGGQYSIRINALVFVNSGNITKANETGASLLNPGSLFHRLEDV